MKPAGSFSKLAAYGVAVAAIILASSAQAAAGSAVVQGVKGTAQHAVGGSWETLTANTVLAPGAAVRTGVNSQIDLSLGANGKSVMLLENTTLELTTLNRSRTGLDVVFETFLTLQTGTIHGEVKKFSEASKYEVKTPHTIVGLKGDEDSEYQISADGKTSLLRGSAVIAYTNPSSQLVTTSTVGKNQSFVPPIDPSAAAPSVRPTQSGDVTPANSVPRPGGFGAPAAPVVAVKEPVQFVSPAVGVSQ
jgi:hypothetical protein